MIESIKDQNKDNVHLNGALNLMPYFTLNASATVRETGWTFTLLSRKMSQKQQVLQSFVQKGGLDVLRPILMDKKNGIQEVRRTALSMFKHTTQLTLEHTGTSSNPINMVYISKGTERSSSVDGTSGIY